jgi:hypothetical protein
MRGCLLVLALLGMSAATGATQDVRQEPPPYRGPATLVDGVFVTPISGVPFTATVSIESVQTLPDGTVEKKHTLSLIARDASGRIHNERRALLAAGFNGMPPLISVHLFDPATRVNDFYNPMTLICTERTLPPLPDAARATNDPNAENLGVKTVSGLEATGTRVTRKIRAQFSGTGQALEITDETWYSEDLHMNLLEQHTDPRSGVQTVTLMSIQRVEPDAALFTVPAGYKIVDMTPPAEAPVAQVRR